MSDNKERNELLERLAFVEASFEQLVAQFEECLVDDNTEKNINKLQTQLNTVKKERQSLYKRYENSLPLRALSRCPFTGEILRMAIDDVGLDGPWWDYNMPLRPDGTLLPTYFAMDGTLCLGDKLEEKPFVCCPGPDLPFVIPRLLSYVQIRAVVSCISIGSHIAYPIFYYADPMPHGLKRINNWGTQSYWEPESIADILSHGQYIELVPDSVEYDFNLEL